MSVKVAILTRNANAWCSLQLKQALARLGVEPTSYSFRDLCAWVAHARGIEVGEVQVTKDIDAMVVRPIGGGSAEEIFFRMDLLRRVEKEGVYVVNAAAAIERAADKYYALTLLHDRGLPVPRTLVAEDPEMALRAFDEFNGDLVVKPLFGSRGVGVTRVRDKEVARRVCRTLAYFHHVLYLQEFVPHGYSDLRVFVVGDQAVAAMKRAATWWKTNVAQGARPHSHVVSREEKRLAVEAAQALGCAVAGVDIMKTRRGDFCVNEVNSQPDWRGLQSVTPISIAEKIAEHVRRAAKDHAS